MTWDEKIINAHRLVTDSVMHYEKLKSDRYFVWQEDGENILSANDRRKETAVSGTTDLFTKIELDPWKAEIEAAFDFYGIVWALNSVQYEEETEFIHYEWTWQVSG